MKKSSKRKNLSTAKKKIAAKKKLAIRKKTEIKKKSLRKKLPIKKRQPTARKKSAAKKSIGKKITDKAALSKTGKSFREWFVILDTAKAEKMNHREMVVFLSKEYPNVSDWWHQMIVVNYEQARGMRQKYEKPTGFEISVSKTVGIPLENLFRSFTDDKAREQWLNEPIFIRRETLHKSLRFDWFDGTPIEVNFSGKAKNKAQVVIQHGKLPDAKAAEKMKTYWQGALNKLEAYLIPNK